VEILYIQRAAKIPKSKEKQDDHMQIVTHHHPTTTQTSQPSQALYLPQHSEWEDLLFPDQFQPIQLAFQL
jgi:hypothetical protein